MKLFRTLKNEGHVVEVSSDDKHLTFYSHERYYDATAQSWTYEVWENGQPDRIARAWKVPYTDEYVSGLDADSLVKHWRRCGEMLNDPILSLQADKGEGDGLAYRFSGDREGVPSNAKASIIKPIFDDEIERMIMASADTKFGLKTYDYDRALIKSALWSKGSKSLVLHIPLHSPVLHEVVINFFQRMQKFFASV